MFSSNRWVVLVRGTVLALYTTVLQVECECTVIVYQPLEYSYGVLVLVSYVVGVATSWLVGNIRQHIHAPPQH
jgi:hypothetical protein